MVIPGSYAIACSIKMAKERSEHDRNWWQMLKRNYIATEASFYLFIFLYNGMGGSRGGTCGAHKPP